MEQIYLQRQRMDGSPCTRPASGTMPNVLQSFWNMEQILMLQVKEASNCVRFQFLTAAVMKIRAFWDIVPCSLVGVDWRFRGAYCLHHHGAISQKALIFK
jgi:hypothetical protein